MVTHPCSPSLPSSLLQLWEDKEGKKKMNKNNAKALSTLRQKIRKYNRDFESHIASYKQVGMLGAGLPNRGDSDPTSETGKHWQTGGVTGEGIRSQPYGVKG